VSIKNILIVLGVPIIVFFLVLGFLNGLKNTEPVVVAVTNIEANTVIEPSMVTVRQMPKAGVLSGAFKDTKDVVGKMVTVPRVPGDQITKAMIGERGLNVLTVGVKPDYRIIAVSVDKTTGLNGMLHQGDRVSIIGIIDPQALQMAGGTTSGVESPAAMFVASGITVAFVPQSFRYSEVKNQGVMGGAAASFTGGKGVVLLDVPIKPVPLAPNGPEISLPELLALINRYGTIQLTLDPAGADYSQPPVGVELFKVYDFIHKNAPILVNPQASKVITSTTGQGGSK